MRAYELNEMNITSEYNQQIVDKLKQYEIESQIVESGAVIVSRDSMIAAFHKGEDESYRSTLELIREGMPEELYITWAGKDDDVYYLSVMKQ